MSLNRQCGLSCSLLHWPSVVQELALIYYGLTRGDVMHALASLMHDIEASGCLHSRDSACLHRTRC